MGMGRRYTEGDVQTSWEEGVWGRAKGNWSREQKKNFFPCFLSGLT